MGLKGRPSTGTVRVASKSSSDDPPKPKVAASTGRKIGTPETDRKLAKPEPPRPKDVPSQAPHPLNTSLIRLLRKIAATDGPGFLPTRKLDLAGIDLLLHNRLIKRGSKDRASGKFHYRPTKGGSIFLEGC